MCWCVWIYLSSQFHSSENKFKEFFFSFRFFRFFGWVVVVWVDGGAAAATWSERCNHTEVHLILDLQFWCRVLILLCCCDVRWRLSLLGVSQGGLLGRPPFLGLVVPVHCRHRSYKRTIDKCVRSICTFPQFLMLPGHCAYVQFPW